MFITRHQRAMNPLKSSPYVHKVTRFPHTFRALSGHFSRAFSSLRATLFPISFWRESVAGTSPGSQHVSLDPLWCRGTKIKRESTHEAHRDGGAEGVGGERGTFTCILQVGRGPSPPLKFEDGFEFQASFRDSQCPYRLPNKTISCLKSCGFIVWAFPTLLQNTEKMKLSCLTSFVGNTIAIKRSGCTGTVSLAALGVLNEIAGSRLVALRSVGGETGSGFAASRSAKRPRERCQLDGVSSY